MEYMRDCTTVSALRLALAYIQAGDIDGLDSDETIRLLPPLVRLRLPSNRRAIRLASSHPIAKRRDELEDKISYLYARVNADLPRLIAMYRDSKSKADVRDWGVSCYTGKLEEETAELSAAVSEMDTIIYAYNAEVERLRQQNIEWSTIYINELLTPLHFADKEQAKKSKKKSPSTHAKKTKMKSDPFDTAKAIAGTDKNGYSILVTEHEVVAANPGGNYIICHSGSCDKAPGDYDTIGEILSQSPNPDKRKLSNVNWREHLPKPNAEVIFTMTANDLFEALSFCAVDDIPSCIMSGSRNGLVFTSKNLEHIETRAEFDNITFDTCFTQQFSPSLALKIIKLMEGNVTIHIYGNLKPIGFTSGPISASLMPYN